MWKKGIDMKGGNIMANQQQPTQYKPEPKEEAVEEKQAEQQEPQQPQSEDIKMYLMHVTDGESEEKLAVCASSIMEAVSIFAERYQEVCADWKLMNISAEEIDILQ